MLPAVLYGCEISFLTFRETIYWLLVDKIRFVDLHNLRRVLQSISIRNKLYFPPQVGVMLAPYRVTLHYHHLPLNQSLGDVIWSTSKSIHYAATVTTAAMAWCSIHLHRLWWGHPLPRQPWPPAFTPPTPSCLVNFDQEPEPTDMKVQSSAMKEGDASVTSVGQGVLWQLAGCIPGCHIPDRGWYANTECNAHISHTRSFLFLVRLGQFHLFVFSFSLFFPLHLFFILSLFHLV
jgi:hypothetical protein